MNHPAGFKSDWFKALTFNFFLIYRQCICDWLESVMYKLFQSTGWISKWLVQTIYVYIFFLFHRPGIKVICWNWQCSNIWIQPAGYKSCWFKPFIRIIIWKLYGWLQKIFDMNKIDCDFLNWSAGYTGGIGSNH